MRWIKLVVFYALDLSCAATGHERFVCFNRPGRIRALWHWSADVR